MLNELVFTIEGVSALIMHDNQCADPIDPLTLKMKKLSGKRAKTEEDHEAMSDIEYQAGLYVDDDGHPCIPGDNIEKMLIEAGRKSKDGKKFQAGVICDGNHKLIYSGPKNLAGLLKDNKFRDRRAMKVQQSTVMRTRPTFPIGWKCKIRLVFNPSVLDLDEVLNAVKLGGEVVGLCDGRPKSGRFVLLD